MTRLLLFVLLCVLAPIASAWAQADASAGGSMDEIENLFSKDEDTTEPAPKATPVPSANDAKPEASKSEAATAKSDIKDVSDLGKLQAFKDIAVIQKRYLPKSQRLEFYIGPTLNLNDAFFFNFGGTARLGYYFRERYGIEGIATILRASERQVTTDLGTRGVHTTSFITPSAYYGADLKWAPMYGKMTWANKKITPFDLYFSFGGGLTSTNQGGTAPTFHLGTGQIFALSKATAFRWDFSWYLFSATSNVDSSGGSALYHNLLFTVGWSWFFPEATYR
jgi:outer membrane beta-barrel protein